MRGAALLLVLLAACTAPRTAPTLTGAQEQSAAATVDAAFAARGCSMPATDLDAALARGPDAAAANAWLAGALARGEITLSLARPVSILTSHRGECA